MGHAGILRGHLPGERGDDKFSAPDGNMRVEVIGNGIGFIPPGLYAAENAHASGNHGKITEIFAVYPFAHCNGIKLRDKQQKIVSGLTATAECNMFKRRRAV